MQSPSFTRYSSGTLEDIAARVVAEFPDHFDDDTIFYLDETQQQQQTTYDNNKQEQEDDKEFEFPPHVAPTEPIIFPIFGRDIINKTKIPRSPLWKLMSEERIVSESCSSSDADELEGVPEETYCVWTPAKSRSEGSSKRWKIRNLLFRSNSDGKGNFVFLANHAAEVGGDGVRTGKIW